MTCSPRVAAASASVHSPTLVLRRGPSTVADYESTTQSHFERGVHPFAGSRSGSVRGSYYTRASGVELQSMHFIMSRADTADVAYFRRSGDNGVSWSEASEVSCGERREQGMWRNHPRSGYVDTATDRFLMFRNEGILPNDEPLEGMRQWTIHYTVSTDGGRTTLVDEPIVHAGVDSAGEPFDSDHPLPGVQQGKAGVMLGDLTCTPIAAHGGVGTGSILVPCQICPIDEEGEYENKGGGLTFHDSAVLHGSWLPDQRLEWRVSRRVVGDPERSSRGFLEPTIAELARGRVLMVMRGSNDVRPELPGHRWYAISDDGARTFSDAQPWRYTDGESLHSPSSCSQLLEHSAGGLYWIGNISGENPRGNRPRFPLMIVEVDRDSGLLLRDTAAAIDDRQPGDLERLTLSNFYAREDRATGEIVVHLPRLFANDESFTADNVAHRLTVSQG
jgi:hypothetical protein